MKPKALKVRQAGTSTTVGIVGDSIDKVKTKIKKYFKCQSREEISLYLEDFTELIDDEYFETLDTSTTTIFCNVAENPQILESKRLVSELGRAIQSNVNNVKMLLEHPEVVEKLTYLSKELAKSTKVLLRSREEHPEWFEGCPTSAKTKEEFMFRRAQDRIRGYLRSLVQAQEQCKSEVLDDVISQFRSQLKKDTYHGHFFDRTATPEAKYCNDSGDFSCNGEDFVPEICDKTCKHLHEINPYDSKEQRILFSTWNLDHIIERSRTVVPSLLTAVSERKGMRRSLAPSQLSFKRCRAEEEKRSPGSMLSLLAKPQNQSSEDPPRPKRAFISPSVKAVNCSVSDSRKDNLNSNVELPDTSAVLPSEAEPAPKDSLAALANTVYNEQLGPGKALKSVVGNTPARAVSHDPMTNVNKTLMPESTLLSVHDAGSLTAAFPDSRQKKQPAFKSVLSETNSEQTRSTNQKGTTIQLSNQNTPSVQSQSEPLFFNVVWGKQSARKHKKWEGDAVLVISGKNMTLVDAEGKEIAKSSSASGKTFESGEQFLVGSKEVEIQEPITKMSFMKGTCFESVKAAVNPPEAIKVIPLTPFLIPLREGAPLPKQNGSVRPRHDPTADGAIVLPRPIPQLQISTKLRIIDVVVDPVLGRHLRKHQIEGIIFMYECVMGYRSCAGNGCILADAMGLGKTLQSITLIWTLLHQGPYDGKQIAKRALIIAPSSLVKNWEKEFRRWLGSERLRPFVVDNKNKPSDFAKQLTQPVMIISYELFVRNADVIDKLAFDLVVCDEAHRMKNLKVKKSESLARLDCTRRIFLTGTPVQNNLSEFYALADTVNPGILGTLSAFKRIFEEPISASRLPSATEEERELGEMRVQELNEIISQFVLRRTQETIKDYLPPKYENVVLCRVSGDQAEIYRDVVNCGGVRSIFSAGYRGCSHFFYISLLRNLCNHPILCKNVEEEKEFVDDLDIDLESLSQKPEAKSTKLEVLKIMVGTLMTRTSEKIVVVSYFTKTLDLIADHLSSMNYRHVRLDGQTKVADRQVIVDRFNRPDSERIFLLSSKAGGVGLNLIGASRIVLYDIDWNPANDEQAMARVWRDGQSRVVHIYRLLTAGTIEEKIFQRQMVKQGLSNSVVDAQELENQKFGIDELRDIFSFKEETTSDIHDLLSCDCDGTGSLKCEKVPETSKRSCQLGDELQKKNKNMGHLMDWQHFRSPFIAAFGDPLLDECSQMLSFVFRQNPGSSK